LQYDDFARYCVKMATGSGKTKVMSLAIAWQFFNAVAEARDDFAKTFLVIAPNVIVFERLRTDFEGARIFRADPVVPPELQIFWRDFQCYMRGEGERASSLGALYLTNVQQFYARQNGDADEPEELTAVLGRKPPAQTSTIEDFEKRIIDRGGCIAVLNDEAHHTHDEESEWNKVIRGLHAANSTGVAAQFDFTATPRHSKGQLFSWTVFDYPLKQAIIDNVVKRPLKGIAQGITEQRSDVASTRYQAYLAAGVERWREYREQLAPLSKRPVLFVMMNDTSEADDVGDWLKKKYPSEFAGEKLLIIHTDKAGEVSKKQLEEARKVSREIDDDKSPVNCIVSVLMLREGWDVQSVTVIVGLRPYTSKANILPEQTVGRGLRLMFRGSTGYIERVDVIGNKTFIEFVEQLEREEDIQLETFKIGEKVSIITIAPDPKKKDKDIAIPVLSPILTRKKSLAEEIAELDVSAFKCPVLPRKQDDAVAKSFRYEGYDIITLQKLIEREYKIPEPQTAEEVIGYYARRIAQDVKLPSQFAALAPKVREFLETKAFGEQVALDEPAMIKAISTNVAQYVTVKTFDRVFADAEHDWDRRGRGFGRKRGRLALGCGNHGDATADEIGHERRQAIILALQPVVLDHHVLVLNVAGFVEAFAEGSARARGILGRPGTYEADDRHRRLLRARCKRPRCRRATEKRDEFAARAHSITSSARASSVGGTSRPSALSASPGPPGAGEQGESGARHVGRRAARSAG
jgi:type III restriction enzyme